MCIKNMISIRSKKEVQAIMEGIGICPLSVEIGEVEINEPLSDEKYNSLKEALL